MDTKPKNLPEAADFAHVSEWVFDLDNTLYPHHVNLFSQIDRNMTAYVAELLKLDPDEARALQKRYYHDHGTTLQGLMIHYGISPDITTPCCRHSRSCIHCAEPIKAVGIDFAWPSKFSSSREPRPVFTRPVPMETTLIRSFPSCHCRRYSGSVAIV